MKISVHIHNSILVIILVAFKAFGVWFMVFAMCLDQLSLDSKAILSTIIELINSIKNITNIDLYGMVVSSVELTYFTFALVYFYTWIN